MPDGTTIESDATGWVLMPDAVDIPGEHGVFTRARIGDWILRNSRGGFYVYSAGMDL
jgi:hypothetical protein